MKYIMLIVFLMVIPLVLTELASAVKQKKGTKFSVETQAGGLTQIPVEGDDT